MPTLHVEVTLTVDDLVKAVQRLDDEDFERFMVMIQWEASRRRRPPASGPVALPRSSEEGSVPEVDSD